MIELAYSLCSWISAVRPEDACSAKLSKAKTWEAANVSKVLSSSKFSSASLELISSTRVSHPYSSVSQSCSNVVCTSSSKSVSELASSSISSILVLTRSLIYSNLSLRFDLASSRALLNFSIEPFALSVSRPVNASTASPISSTSDVCLSDTLSAKPAVSSSAPAKH